MAVSNENSKSNDRFNCLIILNIKGDDVYSSVKNPFKYKVVPSSPFL